eukprot:3085117-Pleurochrysis_carterae.AAC.1
MHFLASVHTSSKALTVYNVSVYNVSVSAQNRASSSADVLAPSSPADPRVPAEDAREVDASAREIDVGAREIDAGAREIDASAREIDASVWRSLGPGANISRAEMRGISLRQIEAIWAEIVRRVEVEEWTAIRPSAGAFSLFSVGACQPLLFWRVSASSLLA